MGIGAHLRRIDDEHRQSGCGQSGNRQHLEAAGRFQRNRINTNAFEPLGQFIDAGMVVADGKDLFLRQDRNIQALFRNVDPNNNLHLIPSLPNRALLSQAALATVRVQWNGGRRPRLSHGLGVPKVHRSSIRHRNRHYSARSG